MIDYLIYVRLVIGVGLLLAGGVSVFLDHSPSQIVLSSMALILGGLFVCLAIFPKDTFVDSKDFQLEEKIPTAEEELIHLNDIDVNEESVKEFEKSTSEKVNEELEK